MTQSRSDLLKQHIALHRDSLLKVLCQYVQRFELCGYVQAPYVAEELMQELFIEALRHPERLPDDVLPLPWLLGIALNLVKRRRAALIRLQRREPLLQDLHADSLMSEEDMIDLLVSSTDDEFHERFQRHQLVEQILADADPDDARLLRLAMEQHFDGDAMAKTLGISPGALRVRLHRVLKRQRQRLGLTQKDNRP